MGTAGVWFKNNLGSTTETGTGDMISGDNVRLNKVTLGENMNIPTRAQFNNLISVCDTTWTDDYNESGVKGMIFKHKENNNELFFPYVLPTYSGTGSPSITKACYWTTDKFINAGSPQTNYHYTMYFGKTTSPKTDSVEYKRDAYYKCPIKCIYK